MTPRTRSLLTLSLLLMATTASATETVSFSREACDPGERVLYVPVSITEIACSSSPCYSQIYTYAFHTTCGGTVNDADGWLSGWKWNWQGGAHQVQEFGVALEILSFDPIHESVEFRVRFDGKISTSSVDESLNEVHLQLVGVDTTQDRALVRSNQSCNSSTSGRCSVQNTFPNLVPSGLSLTGIALRRFHMVADDGKGGGTDVQNVEIRATKWRQQGADLDWAGECALEGSKVSNFDCDVEVVGVAGGKGSFENYTSTFPNPYTLQNSFQSSFTDTMVDRVSPTPPPPYWYASPAASPPHMFCGMEAFSLTFNPLAPYDIWSWWAGAFAPDCDASPGPAFTGLWFGNLGNKYPGSPVPPPDWATSDYDIQLTMMNSKLLLP